MDNDKDPADAENKDMNNPDDVLVQQFCDSINTGSGIFAIIFLIFSGNLVFFNWDMVISIITFFEISSLTVFFSGIIRDFEMTALVGISLAILTGLFIYFRFFSNISHNDFSNDMTDYLKFYETLYSAVIDLTVIAILFVYLIFVKESMWEFALSLGVIAGLSFSVRTITVPYSKIIRDYSAIREMNNLLNTVPKKTSKELFLGEDYLKEFTFFVFMRKRAAFITASLFLTVVIVILGIAHAYNILTILILELMIIRYTLFQSQVGSLPQVQTTLFFDSGEILNHVYILKENREFLLVLSQYDELVILMKAKLKKVEPIIDPIITAPA